MVLARKIGRERIVVIVVLRVVTRLIQGAIVKLFCDNLKGSPLT